MATYRRRHVRSPPVIGRERGLNEIARSGPDYFGLCARKA